MFLLCLITPGLIEDDTGSAVAYYSPDINPTDGYATDNSIVLVEGTIKGQKEGQVEIEVSEIHHPPYANRKEETGQVAGREEQMVVVMSEVHLDSDRVMENVMKVLSGFEDMLTEQIEEDPTFPPPVIVMMGSFTSKKSIHTREGRAAYRGSWSRLEKIISLHPNISKLAKFVFIPGTNDPTPKPLPQMPVPEYFTKPIRESSLVKAHFASNPCRINFASKSCVFYNSPSLTQSLSSSSLVPADKETGGLEHTFKTVLDQGHLSPLPLTSYPTYWKLDSFLSLSPPPHGLILGAASASGYNKALHYSPDENKEGTYCVETGRFDIGDAEFVVYYPNTGEAEFSSGGG